MEGYKAVCTRYFSLWVAEYDQFYTLIEQSGFIGKFESRRPLDVTLYVETILMANSRQLKRLKSLYEEMIKKFGYSKSAYKYLRTRFEKRVKAYCAFFNSSLIQRLKDKPETNAFIIQHKNNLINLLINHQSVLKNEFKEYI